ncbi:hypothetical protein [Aureivirga sp. CE67]|uniref:hypothetical protein n=1 Tax=Aureivirga sp. CE67 TaxID=1788983 RepID=UPI0018CBB5AA|nr:hypothetical protein [Aureivirga sp. CE67]
MFLYFKYKKVKIYTEENKQIACPNCNEKGGMLFKVYKKIFSIFWIPTFPLGKIGKAECLYCQSEFKKSKMSPELIHGYELVKDKKNIKATDFSGLIILCGFISMVFLMDDGSYEEKEKLYLEAPKKGDLYSYKINDKHRYSYLKVERVSEDSIFVIPNSKYSSRIMKMRRINKAENYNPNLKYGISKDEVYKMYQEDKIFQISRKSGEE